MMTTDNAQVTKHGEKRMRERLGLNRRASRRIAQKALENGLTRDDLDGKLRKYVNSAWNQYKTADNMRIYHRHLYIFQESTLITVFLLPPKYFASSDKAEKRMRETAAANG